jgi:hypothetical protein
MHLDTLRVEIEDMTAKKQGASSDPHVDNALLEHLLEQRHEIAEELHNSTSRVQAETALAELTSIDEADQMALLKALAKQQDPDAADILLAINELTPNKAIRKEARRALIQLAGTKIYPSWTPEPEAGPAVAVTNPPRFWKGFVTETREEGELEIVAAVAVEDRVGDLPRQLGEIHLQHTQRISPVDLLPHSIG